MYANPYWREEVRQYRKLLLCSHFEYQQLLQAPVQKKTGLRKLLQGHSFFKKEHKFVANAVMRTAAKRNEKPFSFPPCE